MKERVLVVIILLMAISGTLALAYGFYDYQKSKPKEEIKVTWSLVFWFENGDPAVAQPITDDACEGALEVLQVAAEFEGRKAKGVCVPTDVYVKEGK